MNSSIFSAGNKILQNNNIVFAQNSIVQNKFLYLDTIDDYLKIDTGLPVAAGSDVKFELDLYPAAWRGANPGLWRDGVASEGANFNIFQGTTGRPWIRWAGVNILQPTSGYALPLNEWHHIEYNVVSASSATFSVDGDIKHAISHSVSTPIFTIHNFGFQLTIGQKVAGYYRNMKITINDVLSMYWPINESSGTVLNDLSGNNKTGTIYGGSWIIP